MESKSCVWAEDNVVIAVGIFVLCLDDSGAKEDKTSGSEMTPRHEFNDLCVCEELRLMENLKRRRRIPSDFQRTSLAGLALDSATSSGLGRAPRSTMQDPIQAADGTTRQAGLYTS
ncbi:hypothetical protein TNCV_5124541 [Trichonephila clavipes]|nr:hypothetical protein TNCV_5124541 [Trichonephila clavipes]